LQLVQVADTSDANGDVWHEVARVVGVTDEVLHLDAQQLEILKARVVRDVQVNNLLHRLTASDVFNPEVVESDVGDLHHLHLVDAGEDGVQERNLVHNELQLLGTNDIDSVTDVIGMLDKKEDAGTEEFLGSNGEDEGERQESGSSGSETHGQEARLEPGQEDEDDDQENNEHQNLVKHAERLTNVLHAFGDSLAFLANLHNLARHLLQADISVQVVVNHTESLLGVFGVSRSQHFLEVFRVQRVLSFDDKRHPDAAGESFGGLFLLESLNNDGVGRVGVEDLLSSDFGGNVTEDTRDLVSHAANIADESEGGGRASSALAALRSFGQIQIETIVDDIVLVLELGAVHGEQGARSVVEQTEKADLTLGFLDAEGERTLVIGDTDELDNGLLPKVDGR
ncbi:hypothetical protein CI238_10313, partial [Colletotrichum incanum]